MARANPYPTAEPFLPEKRTATALGRDFRLTQHRSEALESDLAELVTATIHPSAVLRGENREELFPGLVDDLRVVTPFMR